MSNFIVRTIVSTILIFAFVVAAGTEPWETISHKLDDQVSIDASAGSPSAEAERQLRELAAAGQLTVRALRAWGQMPETLMQAVLDLHRDGIDLMGADQDGVQALIARAQQAGSGPAFEQLELLQSLARHMARFAAPPVAVEIDEPAIVDAPAVSPATSRSQRSIARQILREVD